MNLIRKLVAPLMLSAAIASGLSSCVTTSPWQDSQTISTPIGSSKISTQNVGTKITKEKRFDISDVSFVENSYRVMITESLKQSTYKLVELNREQQFSEVYFEKQVTETNFGPLLTTLGVVGGIVGGAMTARATSNKSPEEGLGMEGLLYMTGGAILGGLIFSSPLPSTESIQTRESGRGTRTETSNQGTREIFLSEESIYQNKATEQVRFGIQGVSQTYLAKNGIIQFGENQVTYFTKERLAMGLKNFPLMQQIQPNIRSKLEELILKTISQTTVIIPLETREVSSEQDLTILNGSRAIEIKKYILNDEAIYSAVKQFVEAEINTKIKSLRFRVEDELTHFPIRNSSFKFSVDVPSRLELVEKYFTDELKDYSERLISNYLIGNLTVECLDTITVPVYTPSKINLEVVNPNYNYVIGNFEVKSGGEKVVRMVDKGQKIRVESSSGSMGSIK